MTARRNEHPWDRYPVGVPVTLAESRLHALLLFAGSAIFSVIGVVALAHGRLGLGLVATGLFGIATLLFGSWLVSPPGLTLDEHGVSWKPSPFSRTVTQPWNSASRFYVSQTPGPSMIGVDGHATHSGSRASRFIGLLPKSIAGARYGRLSTRD